VSVFRPVVRVVAPDGEEWELYAYRFHLPARRARDDPDSADDVLAVAPSWVGAALLLDGLAWVVGLVPRALVRALWDLPRATVGALRSDEWTIEAVTWVPSRTSYAWTTTREYRDHVLAQVEGQLARGEVPRPRHATYLGAQG
jgi:hypothetical protein